MERAWCWVSEHVGFCGTIKNSASDFVVTEIDTCGRLVSDVGVDCVQDPNTVGYKQLESRPQPSKRLKKWGKPEASDPEWTSVDHSEDATCTTSVSQAADCELSKSALPPSSVEMKGSSLELLLDSLTAKSLERFALSVKERQPVKGEEEATLLLGTFREKSQRAAVHVAVRQRFPFLKTATSSADIRVQPDPQYFELCRLVSEKEVDGLFRFLDSKDRSSKFSFQPDGNKQHRRSVHHFVSRYFGKLLETKSFSEQRSRSQHDAVITVRFRDKISSSSRKRTGSEGEALSAPYTAFTLCKVNMDTLEAVACLASELGVVPSDFSYAGIKDKKAVTSQTMVVKNVTVNKFKVMQSLIQNKDLKIYNLRASTQHLRVGQLKGNHFRVIIRNVNKHVEDDPEASLTRRVFDAIENVKEKGFVNYYGPQRFGLGQNVQADQIGLALLKQNLVKALHLFFTPEEGNDPVNKAKRHFIQTGDAKATLALMPEYKTRERLVLRALNRYGNGQEGCTRAWLSLPHNMRILYVHSYCSKIWNEAVSFRLNTYDMKVVEGDLVTCDKLKQDLSSQNNQVHIVTAKDVDSDIYSINQVRMISQSLTNKMLEILSRSRSVLYVAKRKIQKQHFGPEPFIKVVLPMPGSSIQYPCNKLTSWYQDALARDGLETCRFRIPALQLNIPGCYRPLLAQPQELVYRWLEGEEVLDAKDDLCLAVDETNLPPKAGDALSLSFKLNSSSYATVCLREIMKCDL